MKLCALTHVWSRCDISQGFILVFSITNDSSFTDLKKIHDSIIEAHPLGENVRACCVLAVCGPMAWDISGG